MSELAVGSLKGLAANSFVIDVASGSSLDLSSGAVLPAGTIIAVKHAMFTGIQDASVTDGGNLEVTDLTITHEVANASNKLIISAFIGAAGSSNGRAQVGIAVHDGTGFIAVGASPGSRTPVTAGGRTILSGFVEGVIFPSATFVHTPGVGSKTYTVRAINLDTVTRTLYINRQESDTDVRDRPRAVSSLVIQEVAV